MERMNKLSKSKNANFLNLILGAAAFICLTLGCSEFRKGFKEGYERERSATSNTSSSSGSESSRPEQSNERSNANSLAVNLTGSWVGRSFDNTKKAEFRFDGLTNHNGDSYGTATTLLDGVKAGEENYRIVGSNIVEFETKQGVRYRLTAEISSDNETLTITTAQGITTKFQRQ